jgi:hypothetical protein
MTGRTATYIKDMAGFTGTAKLYKLSEKVPYGSLFDELDTPEGETEFVVVSACHAIFSGPETYIFPANEEGEVINWGELPGSYRGDLNHDAALIKMGFEPTGWTP